MLQSSVLGRYYHFGSETFVVLMSYADPDQLQPDYQGLTTQTNNKLRGS
jgi:hypothetical protein